MLVYLVLIFSCSQWWRHAHKSNDYDKCYVPAIVFDRLDYSMYRQHENLEVLRADITIDETGSGGKCPDWDQPTEEPE